MYVNALEGRSMKHACGTYFYIVSVVNRLLLICIQHWRWWHEWFTFTPMLSMDTGKKLEWPSLHPREGFEFFDIVLSWSDDWSPEQEMFHTCNTSTAHQDSMKDNQNLCTISTLHMYTLCTSSLGWGMKTHIFLGPDAHVFLEDKRHLKLMHYKVPLPTHLYQCVQQRGYLIQSQVSWWSGDTSAIKKSHIGPQDS